MKGFSGFKPSPVRGVKDTIKTILEPGISKVIRAFNPKSVTTGFGSLADNTNKTNNKSKNVVKVKPEVAKDTQVKKSEKAKVTGTKSKTLSYKAAYKNADKSKYKDYASFEKAAKAYNTTKYGTTEPTKYAKGTGRTKEQLAKDVSKTKANKVANVKNKLTSKKATKEMTYTVSDKKEMGPKNRVTVKKAKSNRKAGVKDAKQKGYETRKDRRTAVRDARKTGRAEVKEARVNKRALKKAVKVTKKRDKSEIKGAISKAKNVAKADKLQSKIDRSSKGGGKVSSRRNLKRADKINKLNA